MADPIYPCLWFDGQAKAAADFYCSIFSAAPGGKNSKVTYDSSMVVMFELNGKKIMALNGGPQFKFSEAVSLVVECESQEEIDYYWNKFTADGGKESMCGWLKDKFGFSWQIVPTIIGSLMSDPEKGPRAMQALMQMKKIDIENLRNA